MKKQGYNSRLDESLGMKNKGKKKQPVKARRNESESMEKHFGKKPFAGAMTMALSKKMKKKS